MNSWGKWRSFFCVVLLLFVFCFTSTAKEHTNVDSSAQKVYTPKKVRVGISISDYFAQKTEDGVYIGILPDYLDEISKYAGWQLEYVEGTPEDLATKLRQGEIDLLGSMLKNEYTASVYDFADYSSGYSYTALITDRENDTYIPMDYDSFGGMRIGIFRKTVNLIPPFDTFIKSNGLDVTPVYYDDFSLFQQALDTGEVDALLSSDTSLTSSQKIIARFHAVPYYFAVTKGNHTLLHELNLALFILLDVNPKFGDTVYEKNFNDTKNELILNKGEKAFISKTPPLRVTILSNLAPLEYQDPSTGEPKGIVPDILTAISKKTGLKFELNCVDSLSSAKHAVLSGKTDLITEFENKSTNEPGFVFTRQYLSTQNALVKNNQPKKSGQPIFAVLNGYSDHKVLKNCEAVTYETIEECIEAVLSGHATYTSFNSLVIDHYTYLRGNDRVSLSPISDTDKGIRFGLAQPADPMLLSILDKAIYSLTPDETQTIVYKNTTSNNAELTVYTLIYTYPLMFALIIMALFVIALLGVLLLVRSMRARLKLAQQFAFQGESYRIISELTNEYIYTYSFETMELVLPKAFADMTGYKSSYTVPDIKDEPVLKALLSAFSTYGKRTQKTIEFQCFITATEAIWFQAVGTVQLDTEKKPVRGIGRITSIQEVMEEKQMLENRANTDPLTGLCSRQYTEQKISEHFAQDKGSGVLMLIDLDFFKTVNDTLGHLVGDQVLKEFAEILISEFRPHDVLGRWGGDEFIAFIQEPMTEEAITQRAESLCKAANREIKSGSNSFILSVSIGVAVADHVSSYKELFQNADAALYSVKNEHRNNYQIYRDE